MDAAQKKDDEHCRAGTVSELDMYATSSRAMYSYSRARPSRQPKPERADDAPIMEVEAVSATCGEARPWRIVYAHRMARVFAWFMAVLWAYVFWNLGKAGAPFLVYLSNWMYIVNALFYTAVVAGEDFRIAKRLALFACPVLLSCDILWSVYTIGLVVYGASCFSGSGMSTFYFALYAFCQGYGHLSPLLLLCFYAAVMLRRSIDEWAALLARGLFWPMPRRVAAVATFGLVLAWLLFPGLPCLVYSFVMKPLVVYGLTMSTWQLMLVLTYSVTAHAAFATLVIVQILRRVSTLRRVVGKNN